MKNTRMVYFEGQDILHLSISEEAEYGSVELSPNITAELNDKDELIAHGSHEWNSVFQIAGTTLENVLVESPSRFKIHFCVSDSGVRHQ